MVRVWRLALIWLMVALLPFKAVAGITMVGCGPQHGAAHAQVVEQQIHVAQHHGDENHDHAAEHSHAMHQASAEAEAAAGADRADVHHDGAVKVKCGTCAPCCAAAAPGFTAHTLPSAAPNGAVASRVFDTLAGVVSDVPHRPPRLNLA